MTRSLVGTLPIYAQHLAELTGIKVQVEGVQARTDGRTVYVPFSEEDLPLSFGYIAHECAHVRNTDMAYLRSGNLAPFRRNLLNILEDIRIERLSMEQYPGTAADLRYLNRKILLEPFQPEQVDALPALHVLHNSILFGGYWLLQEPQLEVPAKAFLLRMQALLGSDLSTRIMDVVRRTPTCNSTTDVLALVDAIIELLPAQDEPAVDAAAPSDPSGVTGVHTHGKPAAEPDAESGPTLGTPSEGIDPSAAQPAMCNQGGEARADVALGQGNLQLSPEVRNLRQQAKDATVEALSGLIADIGDRAAAQLGCKAGREAHPLPPFSLDGRARPRSEQSSARRVQLGLEQSAGLRQCLNGALQAKVDCRVRLKRQGKRIDTGRIVLLKGGETRVFRSKAQAVQPSAAIQILFDKSGSMEKEMDQAEAAVYAVLHALEGLARVTTGAMSFPQRMFAGPDRCALIKSPKERLASAVRAGGFGAAADGGTPLAQALWPAAVEVLRAKGRRKILLVITDGQPNAGTTQAVKTMIERCQSSGIEVIGLGFGGANTDSMTRMFPRYRAVAGVADLKKALFELVRRALVG